MTSNLGVHHILYWVEYFIWRIIFLGYNEFYIYIGNDQVDTCRGCYRTDWSLFQYIKNSLAL